MTSAVQSAVIYSLAMSSVSAFLAGALGILFAWILVRTDVKQTETLHSLLSIPYSIPPYLLAMAWVILGNPSIGILRDFLPSSGSYGFWGITLVLASTSFAYPFMELTAGFQRLDPSLEEAARMSGAKPWAVFRDISLPLLLPSLLNGMCLAFLSTLAAFGVPALLGTPVRKYVLTTLIYSELKLGGLQGFGRGLKLSAILLAIAIVVLTFSYLLNRSQQRRFNAISGVKGSHLSRVKLGVWRRPVEWIICLYLVISVLLPWCALGLSALAPVAGKYTFETWTLKNALYVLSLPDFQSALWHSIFLTVETASLVVAVGFILAFLNVRRRKHWAGAIIEISILPFAIPGTVIAVLFIYLSLYMSRFGLPYLSSLQLMAIAYFVKYLALGSRSLVTAFRQVDPVLEEAARVSGAKTFDLLRTLWIPLLKKNIGTAWLLVALPVFTELTMSVLLTGPDAATLGTVLFDLQEYADQPSAAALAWMLLTLAILMSTIRGQLK